MSQHHSDAPPESEGSSVAPQPAPSSDERAKAGDIKTVDDLIVFAYKQAGKRFSVPSSALEAIVPRRDPAADGEDDRESSLDLIVGLSASDPLLLVPPRLLVAVEDGGAPMPLRRRVAALVAAALRRHPVFGDDQTQLALTSEPRDLDQLFQMLAASVSRVSADRLGIEAAKLKPAEREQVSANATTTLAMVLAIRDRWSLEQFVECLDANLWRKRRKGSREPRALLADSRRPDALAHVADVFAAQARRAEALAAESEEYSRQASRRSFEARSALEEGNRQLAQRVQEIERLVAGVGELEAGLASEQRNRIVDRSHHVDDFEALRTRIVRMLDRQTELLADGLHALRNGSVGVTEEFLERAVDALSKERDQLKADGS
ncbi:hypothetical protein BH20ACT23_BH20ACT23_31210 [soil metagenome]